MDKEIIRSIDTMIYTLENSLKYIKQKKQEIIETNDITICPEIFMEIQNCFMNLGSSRFVMKIIRAFERRLKMKFSDIPKLTSVGSYQVSKPLRYLKGWMEEDQDILDLNPDYQRDYVWCEDQQIKFIEFLLKGGKCPVIYFNHPNWMGNFKGKLEIVDGKQRLNACMKFLNNEIKVFGKFYDEFEDICHADLTININNLKTRKEVLQWYLELNSGGTVHTEEEIEKVKRLLSEEDDHMCKVCGKHPAEVYGECFDCCH